MLARRISRRRRGLTLVEMVIGIAIASFLMIIVAGLQFVSGRAIKDIYNETRTRSSQMRAIDQMRYRLADAKPLPAPGATHGPTDGATMDVNISTDDLYDSTVSVTAYRQIEFENPNNGEGVWSRFSFDATAHKLYYDQNIADGTAPIAIVDGPIDVRFVRLENGAILQMLVRSQAYIAAKAVGEVNGVTEYSVIDEQDGLTTVYLRNH